MLSVAGGLRKFIVTRVWPGVRRRIVARDAIKNAKNAKNAKSANPRRLAFLALLDRAGDLTGAEAGGAPKTASAKLHETS